MMPDRHELLQDTFHGLLLDMPFAERIVDSGQQPADDNDNDHERDQKLGKY
jgi:hypothetical protein